MEPKEENPSAWLIAELVRANTDALMSLTSRVSRVLDATVALIRAASAAPPAPRVEIAPMRCEAEPEQPPGTIDGAVRELANVVAELNQNGKGGAVSAEFDRDAATRRVAVDPDLLTASSRSGAPVGLRHDPSQNRRPTAPPGVRQPRATK